jgi:hypothetical protein
MSSDDENRPDLRSLIDRVQYLADNRPRGEDSVAWAVEAAHLGDMSVIGALAVLEERRASS